MKIDSFQKVVETVVKSSFENQILLELAKIEKKAHADLELVFNQAKIDAKKMAQKMTLELLQQQNASGFTLEIKM